jgi:hypothetical protein
MTDEKKKAEYKYVYKLEFVDEATGSGMSAEFKASQLNVAVSRGIKQVIAKRKADKTKPYEPKQVKIRVTRTDNPAYVPYWKLNPRPKAEKKVKVVKTIKVVNAKK